MKWLLVLLVLIGDCLVINKVIIGFYVWILVDGFFCINNIIEKDYIEATIFGMYSITGAYGLLNGEKRKMITEINPIILVSTTAFVFFLLGGIFGVWLNEEKNDDSF